MTEISGKNVERGLMETPKNASFKTIITHVCTTLTFSKCMFPANLMRGTATRRWAAARHTYTDIRRMFFVLFMYVRSSKVGAKYEFMTP